MDSFTNENLEKEEVNYTTALYEINNFILPALENQLKNATEFCESTEHDASLADIMIYHELQTAVYVGSLIIDSDSSPMTKKWLKRMDQNKYINKQSKALVGHLRQDKNFAN